MVKICLVYDLILSHLHDQIEAVTETSLHKIVRISLVVVTYDFHVEHDEVLVFLFEVVDEYLLLRGEYLIVFGDELLKTLKQIKHELFERDILSIVLEAVEHEFVQYFQTNDRLVQVERMLLQLIFESDLVRGQIIVHQTLFYVEERQLEQHVHYVYGELFEYLAIAAESLGRQRFDDLMQGHQTTTVYEILLRVLLVSTGQSGYCGEGVRCGRLAQYLYEFGHEVGPLVGQVEASQFAEHHRHLPCDFELGLVQVLQELILQQDALFFFDRVGRCFAPEFVDGVF